MDDADRAQAVLERHPVLPPARAHFPHHSDRCLDCHDLISLHRIQAEPTAIRCVHCQTAWERRNGR